MAVAIGTDTVTSIARRWIMPTITDNVYASNVILWRTLRANKRIIQGGTQIEVPVMYKRFAAGGAYRGFDPLDTTPSDTVRNYVFEWKQHYVPWSVSGLTLIQTDSPEAIANFLTLQAQQAYMEMGENLAAGLFSPPPGVGGHNAKDIGGIPHLVGNAAVGDPNYGGVSRSTNPWNNAQVDTTTAALTLDAIHALIMACTYGGQHPTILMGRQEQYNRLWTLGTTTTGYTVQQARMPGGHDEMLLTAGFTNVLVDNIPFVVDSHVDDGPDANNSRIYALNENVLNIAVSPRADFYLEDFQKPVNQDAMVAMLLWAGELTSMSSRLHGVMTNVSS